MSWSVYLGLAAIWADPPKLLLAPMATIEQIRGALLEEAVLFLLKKVGYDTYDPTALPPHHKGYLRAGHSGLEVRGRGTWHQLDAFALLKYSLAFMYPHHLMVEAKFYNPERKVGVEVIRNSVGVLKDISENYFAYTRGDNAFRGPRYNYSAAVFSTSGYTEGAVMYAIAHQVFLIQYEHVSAIKPLIDSIRDVDVTCIKLRAKQAIAAARAFYRRCLSADEGAEIGDPPPQITPRGQELLRGAVAEACRAIQGSYFGMLQGQWPLHLLRREPLPQEAFATDVVMCECLAMIGESGSSCRSKRSQGIRLGSSWSSASPLLLQNSFGITGMIQLQLPI